MERDPEPDEPDFGPPEAPVSRKRKLPSKSEEKRRQLTNAAAATIPSASSYVRSYMHQRTVTHVSASGTCDFVITGSADGHLKFWKRKANSVDFVKTYRAHLGPIASMALNSTQAQLATVGETDRALKIWSVLDFDLLYKHDIDFMPLTAAYVPNPFSPLHEHVAVSEKGSVDVHIFTAIPTGAEEGPIRFINSRHRHHDVHLMTAHPSGLFAFSSDRGGAIEAWALTESAEVVAASPAITKNHVRYQLKSETDFYCLQEAKTYGVSMAVSPDGSFLAVFGADGLLRIFKVATGKLYRIFDESVQTQGELQKSGKLAKNLQVTPGEIDEIIAAEETEPATTLGFHPSSMLIIFSTPFGIRVLDFHGKSTVALLGRNEKGLRFTSVAYSQCSEKLHRMIGLSASMRVGSEQEMEPMIIAAAAKKNRFYMFTNQEGAQDTKRDVMNELPSDEDVTTMQARKQADKVASANDGTSLIREPKRATIHTTFGDIKLLLFPEECPKTVENFAVHAQQGYYNNVIFHRVIKGFMIQTGDPNGDGTGGESIWGGEFNDEFSRKLKHDRPYTLSMANAGPNTNGSQFFITTVPTPFLDNKHTVFGRVENGTHVIHEIETVRTTLEDKPLKDIKILTIRVSKD